MQEFYRKTVSLPQDFTQISPTEYVINDLYVPPGTYSVSESGGFALAHLFLGTPPSVIMVPPPILPPSGYLADLTNSYTYDSGLEAPGLYLFKAFHGVFESDLLPGFQFILKGPGSFEKTYTASDLFSSAATGGIHLQASDGIVPGLYTVEEVNNGVDGFRVDFSPKSFTLTADQISQGVMIVIENTYTQPTYNLNILKILQGLGGSVDIAGNPNVPADMVFKIERTDPTGFLQTIRYVDMVNGGASLTDLTAGTYTITEIGGVIPDFNGPGVSFSMTINGSPATPNPNSTVPNSYIFTLSGTDDVNIACSFVNTYSVPPTPVPPGPSPQTGEYRNLLLPIIILVSGALLLIVSELYRRQIRKVKK